MLSSLYTHLTSIPPEHTAFLVTLGTLTPGFLMVLGGFAFCHAADVAAQRGEEL